jgi:hypothetical protein
MPANARPRGAAGYGTIEDTETMPYEIPRPFSRHWPGYEDEAARFALGSFTALGGGYAAARELQRRLRGHNRPPRDFRASSASQ